MEQTLQDTASSSLVAMEYSASYEADEDLYVLSTSSGSELRVVVRQDPAYNDLHATQMVVQMETAGDTSERNETLAFVEAIQAIDNRTERQGIEEIRGEFNYVDALRA